MARTYREIAIEDMVLTAEEAMSRVLDWWGDLPHSMKEAIEQFRTNLGLRADPRGPAAQPIRPWARRSAGGKLELGQHFTPQ